VRQPPSPNLAIDPIGRHPDVGGHIVSVEQPSGIVGRLLQVYVLGRAIDGSDSCLASHKAPPGDVWFTALSTPPLGSSTLSRREE